MLLHLKVRSIARMKKNKSSISLIESIQHSVSLSRLVTFSLTSSMQEFIRMIGWMDGRPEGRMDGWTDGRTDGLKEGWMDWRMDLWNNLYYLFVRLVPVRTPWMEMVCEHVLRCIWFLRSFLISRTKKTQLLRPSLCPSLTFPSINQSSIRPSIHKTIYPFIYLFSPCPSIYSTIHSTSL